MALQLEPQGLLFAEVGYVVVCHVTVVAIGHGLFEDILAYGHRLRTTHYREFHYYADTRTS